MRRLPRMLALEVWNEPNLPRFFAPQPSPAGYSRLLRAAGRAARLSGDPVTILTGGLTASASRADGGIPAPRFLARIYQLNDKASFDGIGAHPYPQRRPRVRSMSASLDRLRRVRDRFDDRETPLWVTEVGVGGTSGRRSQASVALARQGPVLARMYRSAQRRDVKAFIFYALRDSPTEGPKFEPFGVVRANLRPKPAYCYLASHLGGVTGMRRRRVICARRELGCGGGRGPDLKRPLLTAIVVGALAYASVASAAATQIQVDDSFYSPRTPPTRPLSSGASFTWTTAPLASLAHNVRQDALLFNSGSPTRNDQLLDQGLGGHLPLLLHPARLA